MPLPVIAIFDIGKTNKKLLLLDELYNVVDDESDSLDEITDEDGFACEDVNALTRWMKEKFDKLQANKNYTVKALNFSGYGASFVYLDDGLNVFLPLYNYLKPYPAELQKKFYGVYGGETKISQETASPVLGNLNSGMQLYRLKYEKPGAFSQIKCALHLPQYLSYIFSGKVYSDITSTGCHTQLWDFEKNNYHDWTRQEGILSKLPPLLSCGDIAGFANGMIAVGAGLHDSSSALIPYLSTVAEPFVLLSTGTWCISLNPFNHSPLTEYELHHDCLCYLSYEGKPVKASRLFSGHEHETQIKKITAHFSKAPDYYKTIDFDFEITQKLKEKNPFQINDESDVMLKASVFENRSLGDFATCEEAYHQLIADIIALQTWSTKLVLNNSPVKKIFVDGGFAKNPLYMNLLASAFKGFEVYAASIAKASALGAAIAIHKHWNGHVLPGNLIKLKLYS